MNFFKQTISKNFIGLFRIVTTITIAIHLALNSHYVTAPYQLKWNPITLFEFLGITQWNQNLNWFIYGALILFLLLSAIGVFARWFIAGSVFLFFLFMGNYLGISKSLYSTSVWHNHNLIFMLLVIMPFLPSVTNLSILKGSIEKNSKRWEEYLILLTIATAYFGAGYCKLAVSGIEWANGYTLQAILLKKYLLTGNIYAKYLASNYTACFVLSGLTLLLECVFIFGLLLKGWKWVVFISLFIFHWSTGFFMDVHFLNPHFLICSTYFMTLIIDRLFFQEKRTRV